MLSKYLIPDYVFETYGDVTPAFLESIGVRALLIDIDNTLAPYEQPTSDERHRAWFDALDAAGLCIKSSLIIMELHIVVSVRGSKTYVMRVLVEPGIG